MDGILLVNKPEGFTSHDLCMKARKLLMTKKIGHTGTLDPLATGLMILTVGKATKILSFIKDDSKEYIATLKLGFSTDTLDVTGQITASKPVIYKSEQEIKEVLNSFLGPSMQVPPMFSAKKINGQKLYDLARKNIEVERAACPININTIELLEVKEDTISFKVSCSAGTYVRVLCKDIAEKLDNLGTMTSLKRTKINDLSLDDSYTLEDLQAGNFKLISINEALKRYPVIEYEKIEDVYNGKAIKLENKEELVMISDKGNIIAAYEKSDDGLYRSKRGLW